MTLRMIPFAPIPILSHRDGESHANYLRIQVRFPGMTGRKGSSVVIPSFIIARDSMTTDDIGYEPRCRLPTLPGTLLECVFMANLIVFYRVNAR